MCLSGRRDLTQQKLAGTIGINLLDTHPYFYVLECLNEYIALVKEVGHVFKKKITNYITPCFFYIFFSKRLN